MADGQNPPAIFIIDAAKRLLSIGSVSINDILPVHTIFSVKYWS